MNSYTLALLALTPLLVWRVYSRLKGMMQRQRSLLARHTSGLVVFGGMLVVLASSLVGKPMSLVWLGLGTVGGIGYGVWGLRLTRYEATPQGYFFTPNARLGIAVGMLFVARLLYVGFDIYAGQNGVAAAAQEFNDSALSLMAVGLLAGYFGGYSAGLLRWRRAERKAHEA